MRLDAVASAGFGYRCVCRGHQPAAHRSRLNASSVHASPPPRGSRSKMAGLVDKGLVCVDFKEVRNAAQNLRAGQEVSVRGAGRLVVEEAQQTSKGRFKVKMMRFT